MLPLRDNIPARHYPVINVGIIAANIAIFIFEWRLGGHMEPFIRQWGFVPARFQDGGLEPMAVSTIFTSMFLHGSLFHVLSNMWILWIFGDNVEDLMGHGGYMIFYLLCGVASVFTQYWSAPGSVYPMVGASGAIAGILGAYFLSFPKAKILTLLPFFFLFYMVEVPAYFFLGVWFLLQFIQGSIVLIGASHLPEGGIAWWAHVGGFAGGILLLPVFRKRSRRKRPSSLHF
ncbi:MAG: rhomboid family intramembrane serine protease [Desulfobacteraceae bacterium]|nr:rhomboid family intramembrane serine protease [Desulfobacteraceae bacterium]